MIDKLFDIDILKLISKYSIEYGILTEDGLKTVEVSILNTDGSNNTTLMNIHDITYFAENGTLVLPGKHIFEKLNYLINNLINETLDNIINRCLNNDILEHEIDNIFQQLEFKITNLLQSEFENAFTNDKLNSILNTDNNTTTFYNSKLIKNYLKCKITKVF